MVNGSLLEFGRTMGFQLRNSLRSVGVPEKCTNTDTSLWIRLHNLHLIDTDIEAFFQYGVGLLCKLETRLCMPHGSQPAAETDHRHVQQPIV